ncbi:hypothetical protein DFQ30_000756 [Apophysomyces sp. BC1015]|nr:hypothetical protein DFQ30_000756 [Apophysomyces sp. BC1015]KAG0180281.1 hypothetical protein DFQ29_000940 [Apophysomyces sp. BC1021]
MFQYIAEANIREQINKFATNMVNRYKTSIETFDGDRCQLEVENLELGKAGADQEDLEEHDQKQEQERQAVGDILADLANNVHIQIENFITTERNLQVKGIRVSEVNLSECLGKTGRRGTNGGGNDEDDVFHRTHGGKLSKAKAARLIPFLIYFLERREGNFKSFVLYSLQAHHPFLSSIIEQLEQELQAGPNERGAHQLTRERKNLQNACTRLQGIGRTDPFSALFDICRQATIARDGSVDVRDRGYMRWLDQRILGNINKPRFTKRRVFRTDCVRLYCIYNDWLRSCSGNTTCKYLTELRRTTRETLKDTWEGDSHGDQFDYLQHYDGIVGLDFGEVCAAASVFRPREPGLCGSQLTIKRGYLYGRTIPNRDWLEARKAVNNIDDIEAALSEGSPRSTYARYQEYLRQLKENDNNIRPWKFYSNRSVRRRVWDNVISQRSYLDKACYLITNQAMHTFGMNREIDPTTRHVECPRLVYAFGLDRMSRKSRKGALAPMDHKIAKTIEGRIDNMPIYTLKSTNISRRSSIGQEKVLRIVQCANCGRTFHRDGNAADNQTTIARYMLRFQQRPRWFIRPSRRLETSSDGEATASGFRRSPSEGTTLISGSSQERASVREATRTPGPRRRPREEEALETTRSVRRRTRARRTQTMVEPPGSAGRTSQREEE